MLEWLDNILPTWVSSKFFSSLADVLSVVGFIITIFVMIGIGQIKGYYTSRIRVPKLRVQIESHASKIGEYLNDYPNNKELISLELAKTEPILQAIKKRLAWSERGKINVAIKLVNNLQKKSTSSKDEIRNIFDRLHGINAELQQWEIDKEWSI